MRDATIGAVRLALGREPDPLAADQWRAVLRAAIGERLAALAWLRSGARIRAAAPTEVVDCWRTHAIAVDERGRDRLGLLAVVAMAFDRVGLPTIVLKGMPLAQRLYGDPFVRASDDVDLLVAAPSRGLAAQALVASGWHHETGAPPWDELFSRGPRTMRYLEVHETLTSDYLSHLRLPEPRTAPIDLGGVTVQALDDPIEPAYLAAHLAGHQLPPLLWLVDFKTLWEGLDDARRTAAMDAAREFGLHRYLEWAVTTTAMLNGCVEGDRASLIALGIGERERRDPHLSIWRHARLAPTPLDACRAIGACLWPRPLRGNWRAMLTDTGRRVRRRLSPSPSSPLTPPDFLAGPPAADPRRPS